MSISKTRLAALPAELAEIYTASHGIENEAVNGYINKLDFCLDNVGAIGTKTAQLCVDFHNTSEAIYHLADLDMNKILKVLKVAKDEERDLNESDLKTLNKATRSILEKGEVMLQTGHGQKLREAAKKEKLSIAEFLASAGKRQMQTIESFRRIKSYKAFSNYVRNNLNDKAKEMGLTETLGLYDDKASDSEFEITMLPRPVGPTRKERAAAKAAEEKAAIEAAAKAAAKAAAEAAAEAEAAEAAEKAAALAAAEAAEAEAEKAAAEEQEAAKKRAIANAEAEVKNAQEALDAPRLLAAKKALADLIGEDEEEQDEEEQDEEEQDDHNPAGVNDSDSSPKLDGDHEDTPPAHVKQAYGVDEAFNGVYGLAQGAERVDCLVKILSSAELKKDLETAIAIAYNSDCQELVCSQRLLSH